MSLDFSSLAGSVSGELYYDDSVGHKAIKKVYATDASVYQEQPLAVAIPKTIADIKSLVAFARWNRLTLIPRAAGTSLAGQVVGNGIVVDISKNFTSILELNEKEGWVRVQPGVIRDDLNAYLKPYGLMFGPETSTANRAMIGGMIGNNSCGLHSIIWGDTRKNLLEVKAILFDGSEIVFRALSEEALQEKLNLATTEGEIYRAIDSMMDEPGVHESILQGFPKASVTRRNTGYALDAVSRMWQQGGSYNLSQIIAGSEGTLCFITEAKLRLIPQPPTNKCIVAVHTSTIKEALIANLVAMSHNCAASELVDDFILEFTKTNIQQSKNRFFVLGEPKAILMVEFFDEDANALVEKANRFTNSLIEQGLGYHHPLLLGAECLAAWDLRKAGLGLLRNEPGDWQPVNLIEDCAVDVNDLPAYIEEIETLLQQNNLKYSVYAHAAAGELHVEPMMNLKTAEGKKLFKSILAQAAVIVKKYGGSLSGEHGDGRLRGEFIPLVMGEAVFGLFKRVKKIFDPEGVFNLGKIVDAPPMNEMLRVDHSLTGPTINTIFDFSNHQGILHLAEKCSGSGDCRKTAVTGGTMCPSYMATRSERDTTRARANILRNFYSGQGAITGHGKQDKQADKQADKQQVKERYEEVNEVLDLCLSCKGCKSECPSSVDVGKMKAEFTQQYHDSFGAPLRSRLIANFSRQMKLASVFPPVYNLLFGKNKLREKLNTLVGFHPKRSMPYLHKTTLRQWYEQRKISKTSRSLNRKVYLFCDEFSNYNDVNIGKKTILLLEALGYEVIIPKHDESGRSYLSKGFVRKAKEIAAENVSLLSNLIHDDAPLIGIEPSAILSFRDEYPDLVSPEHKMISKSLAKNCFLFEEWFAAEVEKGFINPDQFTSDHKVVHVHGHCHQKALSSVSFTLRSLSLPRNYVVHEIPSGCCGMAGSFGYEKEHYDVSMQIGELVLFPAVRNSKADFIIAAPGTSCRHQIKDGTGRIALHPAEVLFDALKSSQNN